MKINGNVSKLETQSVSARQITNLLWDEIDDVSVPHDWWEYFEEFCKHFSYKIGAQVVHPYRGKNINGRKVRKMKENFKEYLKILGRQDIVKSFEGLEMKVCLKVQKLIFKPYIQQLTTWLNASIRPGQCWCLGMLLPEHEYLHKSFHELYIRMRDQFPQSDISHEVLMKELLSDTILKKRPYNPSEIGRFRSKYGKSVS